MAVQYPHQAWHPHGRTHWAHCAPAALLLLAALASSPRAEAQSIPVTQAIGSVPTTSLYPGPDGCANPDPTREQAFLATRVAAPRKEAWQAEHGGQAAAKPHVKARLSGWPQRLLVDRATLPQGDAEFLGRLARDTWRGLDALTDREHAIPVDHVRFCGGSLDASRVKIGDYTSGTNIGLYLMATVGRRRSRADPARAGPGDRAPRARDAAPARDPPGLLLQLLRHHHARAHQRLRLLRRLGVADDGAHRGAPGASPSSGTSVSELVDRQDYGLFYDPKAKLMSHGLTIADGKATPSQFHYGMLYTEARLGSLIAIGRGDAPEDSWFAMHRTLPPSTEWQTQKPLGHEKTVRGHSFYAGTYTWRDLRYVPSWGGSLFEALMPVLALDERAFAPRSLGRNDEVHVEVQRLYAEQLGQPVWGMSPSSIARLGRLRRVRRRAARDRGLSRRHRDAARLGAGARRRARGRHREPARDRFAI